MSWIRTCFPRKKGQCFGLTVLLGFPGSSVSKEHACNVVDLGLIPGLGRSLGEGNGNLLQYFCLENPMDRGAWQAIVHGVAESRIQLSVFCLASTVLFLGFPLRIICKQISLPPTALQTNRYLWIWNFHFSFTPYFYSLVKGDNVERKMLLTMLFIFTLISKNIFKKEGIKVELL